jgi:hypothetical protein
LREACDRYEPPETASWLTRRSNEQPNVEQELSAVKRVLAGNSTTKGQIARADQQGQSATKLSFDGDAPNGCGSLHLTVTIPPADTPAKRLAATFATLSGSSPTPVATAIRS